MKPTEMKPIRGIHRSELSNPRKAHLEHRFEGTCARPSHDSMPSQGIEVDDYESYENQ